MSDESVGYYWEQAAKESEAIRQHDQDHDDDPVNWCEECSICMERVEEAEKEAKHKADLALDKSIEADAFPNK